MTPNAISLASGLARRFEGCCLTPNRDPVGLWQIGWGSRWLASGQAVTYHARPLTQDQADALLEQHLATFAAQVEPLLPAGATDGQAGALLDFAYNEGIYALKRSTLLRLFRAGDLAGAAEQFGAWIYAGGKVLSGLVTAIAEQKAGRVVKQGVFTVLVGASGWAAMLLEYLRASPAGH